MDFLQIKTCMFQRCQRLLLKPSFIAKKEMTLLGSRKIEELLVEWWLL
jgi:hypothetical protein